VEKPQPARRLRRQAVQLSLSSDGDVVVALARRPPGAPAPEVGHPAGGSSVGFLGLKKAAPGSACRGAASKRLGRQVRRPGAFSFGLC
jgi:hypothetical protein